RAFRRGGAARRLRPRARAPSHGARGRHDRDARRGRGPGRARREPARRPLGRGPAHGGDRPGDLRLRRRLGARVSESRRASLSAPGAIGVVAARQAAAARAEVVARVGLYVVILVVFSRLWRAAAGAEVVGSVELLWYLAATEWVLISIPYVHLEIERDVR